MEGGSYYCGNSTCKQGENKTRKILSFYPLKKNGRTRVYCCDNCRVYHWMKFNRNKKTQAERGKIVLTVDEYKDLIRKNSFDDSPKKTIENRTDNNQTKPSHLVGIASKIWDMQNSKN